LRTLTPITFAPTSQLARGEIQNAGLPSKHVRANERAAANQLDVIRMSCDCEDVYVCHAGKLRVQPRTGYRSLADYS